MLDKLKERCVTFSQLKQEKVKFEKHVAYHLNITQKDIWQESFKQNSVEYNNSLLMKIDSWIDIQRLKEAFVTALHNHPFLSAKIFLSDDNTPMFRRIDNDSFGIDSIEEIHNESKDIDDIKNDLKTPFELVENRLFRVKIIYAKGVYVFVEAHSIICDAASLLLFLENVSKAYLGHELDKEVLDGYDSILWEDEFRSQGYEAAKNYYETILNDCNKSFLPIRDQRGIENNKYNSLQLVSRRCITDMVRAFCTNNCISIKSFFCAAFGFLITKYINEDISVFNTVYNGRTDLSLKNTVSALVKYFPIQSDLKDKCGSNDIADYLKDIENQFLDAEKNSLLSFSEIKNLFGIKSDILFVFHGEDFNFNSFCGKISKPVKLDINEIKNSIRFQVSLHGAEVTYDIDYDIGFYSNDFMESFIDAFDMVVSEFLTKKTLSEIETTSYKSVKTMREFNNSEKNSTKLIFADKNGYFTDLTSSEVMKIYILDKNQRLLPVGAVGKLCLSFAGESLQNLKVIKSYTKDYFENPFNNNCGYDKIMETDINARWLKDGNIELF